MRGGLLFLALLPLAACQSEPSFDERFENAEQAIREKALKIDAELEKNAKSAPDAEASAAPTK